jgi:hypothetical protein
LGDPNNSQHSILGFPGARWHDEITLEAPAFHKASLSYMFTLALPEASKNIVWYEAANLIVRWV